MDRFDFFSPLDYRYVDAELAKKAEKYFSENARIRHMARVEAALVKALARQGVCSRKIVKQVEKATARVTAAEVYEEEKRIKHDVRGLVNILRSKVGEEAKPFIHFCATSYDIVDTANALRYKEGIEELLIPELKGLLREWIKIAQREKNTLQIGRTHGQHAEPITFGFAMLSYINRLGECIASLEWYTEHLEGKFSGAVGAYNASSLIVDPLRLEKDIMQDLGLKVGMHSTQIVEPESLLDLLHSTLETFTVLANFADDMRHLQRTEIMEIAEGFGEKQVGSSTMPHKRNPINFENVKSLWKAFVPRAITFYMDAVSEHQRDLTNSASQRFVPELFLALLVSTKRMLEVSKKMVVERQAMKGNFELSRERVVAEPLYILLAKHGHRDAHEAVRQLTIEADSRGLSVLELAKKHHSVSVYIQKFSKKEMDLLNRPEKYIGLSVERTEAVCRHWKKRFKE